MKEKILITGVTGFLGSRAADYFKEKYQIIPAAHKDLDITNEAAVRSFLSESKPDVVLHCAAVSDTGRCEQQPETAQQINVHGTVNIGKICADMNSRMIFMSSDQIYFNSLPKSAPSDPPHPNAEDDDYSPANIYGQCKLLAERELLNVLPSAVCLRLTWMYDLPVRNRKTNSNLLCGLLKTLVENTTFTAPVFDYRGITDAGEVTANLEKAFRLPGGVYNFGSGNTMSTYETACRLMKLLAPKRTELIIPDTERFSRCPRNLLLDQTKAEQAGITFSDTMDGFEKCLKEYGF